MFFVIDVIENQTKFSQNQNLEKHTPKQYQKSLFFDNFASQNHAQTPPKSTKNQRKNRRSSLKAQKSAPEANKSQKLASGAKQSTAGSGIPEPRGSKKACFKAHPYGDLAVRTPASKLASVIIQNSCLTANGDIL